MKDTLKPAKRREPIVDSLPIPVATSLKERYRRLENEIDKRKLTKLHDLTRERLESMLDEVEMFLAEEAS